MTVIPAVDIRGGLCVRLREGRADQETVFSEDPAAMARRWVDLGSERLHVVDLDGALGRPRQSDVVARGRYLDQWSCRDGRWGVDARRYVDDITQFVAKGTAP